MILAPFSYNVYVQFHIGGLYACVEFSLVCNGVTMFVFDDRQKLNWAKYALHWTSSSAVLHEFQRIRMEADELSWKLKVLAGAAATRNISFLYWRVLPMPFCVRDRISWVRVKPIANALWAGG